MARKRQTQTQKLRSLVKQQIRRMEKRGYQIPSEIKESVGTAKYQTLKSIQRNKYSKLYKEAEVKAEGKTYTGTEYRTIERKQAARKAVETRKNVADFSDLAGTFNPETGTKFETEAEREFYQRTGYEFGETMTAEEASQNIIDTVLSDIISKLEQDTPEYWVDSLGRRHWLKPELRDDINKKKSSILNILNNEIDTYGASEVASRLQNSASLIMDLADKIFSYYDLDRSTAYNNLVSAITGRTLSVSEMNRLDATTEMINGYNEPE